jgi:hypothetical protein
MGDSKTCPALMVCVYVDDKNFRKSVSYFRLKGRCYDYGLGKVVNQIFTTIIYQKLIEESASEDCEAM